MYNLIRFHSFWVLQQCEGLLDKYFSLNRPTTAWDMKGKFECFEYYINIISGRKFFHIGMGYALYMYYTFFIRL